jgi:uncharacterized protein YcgI (DUF1989 family)
LVPKSTVIIPPKSAKALTIRQGEILRITDVKGRQPGDLIAFNLHDLTESFSQSCTRVENQTCFPTTSHDLWTGGGTRKVMFRIRGDTAGNHALLYAPCSCYVLGKRFNTSGIGCREHLMQALAPWSLPHRDLPDPLNLFLNVTMNADGAIALAPHSSDPGEHLELEAMMDCLVAISTCSVPQAGRENSEYYVEICG